MNVNGRITPMSIAPHLVIGIGHVGSDVVTNAAALGLFSRI
ncbi:lactate dehydrogenase, partial [Cutibacterium acnes]